MTGVQTCALPIPPALPGVSTFTPHAPPLRSPCPPPPYPRTHGGGQVDVDTLLELLAVNRNRVLSKAEIAEKVWNIRFDSGTNVIEVYMNFLRKKIDSGFEVKLLHTLVGMGYMMKNT